MLPNPVRSRSVTTTPLSGLPSGSRTTPSTAPCVSVCARSGTAINRASVNASAPVRANGIISLKYDCECGAGRNRTGCAPGRCVMQCVRDPRLLSAQEHVADLAEPFNAARCLAHADFSSTLALARRVLRVVVRVQHVCLQTVWIVVGRVEFPGGPLSRDTPGSAVGRCGTQFSIGQPHDCSSNHTHVLQDGRRALVSKCGQKGGDRERARRPPVATEPCDRAAARASPADAGAFHL